MSEPESDHVFEYVDRESAWESVAGVISQCSVLAVDTEADSMHSYFEKVCLVQLATDAGDAFIVDPLSLDLGALGRPLADPAITCVFHGADFDVMSLRRDFAFDFDGIFDTMIAAQLLGDERLSLRDLVDRFFDVQLSKGQTRTDWGRRPLSPQQIEYSYLDVKYLVELYRIQAERLREAGLEQEARIEFERLSRREGNERVFDPHGWTRIKGSRNLAPEEQSVLVELHAVRDKHARKLDRPAFKVLSTDSMLRISRVLPEDMATLKSLKGVSSFVMARMGRDVLKAVTRGRRRETPPRRPPKQGDPARRLDFHGQRRLGRLRDWRNATSEKIDVTTMAILPNYAMFWVARERPSTLEELAATEGVGPQRAEKYGEKILSLVN